MALTAFKNLFSRPATRVEVRPPYPGARGQLALDLSTCVFCGVCARRCPSGAIEVSREARRVAIEHLRCVLCGVCVDACAKHSLSLEAEPLGAQLEGKDRHRVEYVKPSPTASDDGPSGKVPKAR
jgi:ech hydrogenase subunit F